MGTARSESYTHGGRLGAGERRSVAWVSAAFLYRAADRGYSGKAGLNR